MAIRLIVGLRNPGSIYKDTRHNAGEWFVTLLTQHYHGTLQADMKLQAELGEIDIANIRCKVLLPLTFMNTSGIPIRVMSQFYQILPDEILIVHDDLDLPAGKVKFKTNGGNGGHNGLRNVAAQLGSSGFHRLRLGIGHPGDRSQVLDYVLSKPSVHEKQLIDDAIQKNLCYVETIVSGHFEKAKCLINGQDFLFSREHDTY